MITNTHWALYFKTSHKFHQNVIKLISVKTEITCSNFIPECFRVLVVHDASILSFTDLGGTPDMAPNLSKISPFVGAIDLRLVGPVSRGEGCFKVLTKASVSFKSIVSYLQAMNIQI